MEKWQMENYSVSFYSPESKNQKNKTTQTIFSIQQKNWIKKLF